MCVGWGEMNGVKEYNEEHCLTSSYLKSQIGFYNQHVPSQDIENVAIQFG